jgi:myosin heavy subunit
MSKDLVTIDEARKKKELKKLIRSANALSKTWGAWCKDPSRQPEDFEWAGDYLEEKGYSINPLYQGTEINTPSKLIAAIIQDLLDSTKPKQLPETVDHLRKMGGAWRSKKNYQTGKKRQIRLVLNKEEKALLKAMEVSTGRGTLKKALIRMLGEHQDSKKNLAGYKAELEEMKQQASDLSKKISALEERNAGLADENIKLKEIIQAAEAKGTENEVAKSKSPEPPEAPPGSMALSSNITDGELEKLDPPPEDKQSAVPASHSRSLCGKPRDSFVKLDIVKKPKPP